MRAFPPGILAWWAQLARPCLYVCIDPRMFPTAVLRLSPRACACSKQDYTFAENDGFDDNGKLNTNSIPRRSCVARIPRVVMASVRVRCVDAVCRNSKVPTQCAAVGKSAPQPAPGYAKFKHDSDGTWDCYRLGSAPPTPHTHTLTQVHASTHARTHARIDTETHANARVLTHTHTQGMTIMYLIRQRIAALCGTTALRGVCKPMRVSFPFQAAEPSALQVSIPSCPHAPSRAPLGLPCAL